MQIFAVLVLAFLSLTMPAFAKVFTRCTLAKAMFALGVPKSELPQWTCIAKHESAFRTDIVGSKNSNASNDYGIFQINGLYWCRPENKRFSNNGCKISCKALLRDNIYDSVTCARKIKSQRGWHAWSTWKYCSGSLDSINDCF